MAADVLDRKEYRTLETRPRVLAESFRKSRDQWKRKCQQAKGELKSLRDRMRDLELSRAKWRDDAELSQHEQLRLQDEVEQLQSQLSLSAQALADAPKKTIN